MSSKLTMTAGRSDPPEIYLLPVGDAARNGFTGTCPDHNWGIKISF